MRLRLCLRAVSSKPRIPINYNYYFSAAIYLLLKFGSKEFAQFLHDEGYRIDGKQFKLFTFGVELTRYKLEDSLFLLLKPEINLTISSPMVDSFIQNFVMGSFEKQTLDINYYDRSTQFTITQVESLPAPEFREEMKFRLISPLVASTVVKKDGKRMSYYYRYDDSDLPRLIKKNLVEKYRFIYNRDIDISEFEFTFDQGEINKRYKKVSKLITVAEGTPQETKIKAIQCGFKIKTDTELIKVGYDCGFGEKNSMGFGLADTNYTN
jgi:CRISPR-associated endoribonuclease Cas6